MPIYDVADLQEGYLNGRPLRMVIRNGVVVWESDEGPLPEPVELEISATPLPAPTFPIRIRPDGRGFEDAAGVPFFGVGDTVWNLPSRMSLEEVQAYATRRRQQGYNLVQISLLDINSPSRGRPQITTGVLPFAGTGDAANFTQPVQAYFDAVKAKLDVLRAAGFYVGIVPGWFGYAGNRWRPNWGTNPTNTTIAVAYANYLAAQFGGRDHIYWVHGGDCSPVGTGLAVQDSSVKIDLTTITNAFASTLDSAASANQLHTYHTGRAQNARDHFPTATWMHINPAYAAVNVPAETTVEWARGDRPVIMVEGYYQNAELVGADPILTPPQVRATAWHSIVTGAFLVVNGNHVVWPVREFWTSPQVWNNSNGVDHVSATWNTVLSRVLASFPGKTFLPDASTGALVTTGRGSGVTLTAGLMSTDRRVAIVYVPAAKTFTLDLTQFAIMPTLGWVNPETGALTALPMPTGTTATLTTPSGWADAVLVCVS